jgi:D-amino peptidase
MIKKTAFLIALLLLFATGSFAQGKQLKVYISADSEGVGGVSTWDVQASAKGREYEQFRRLMTLEVNAAIAGAFDAVATEVLVSDSHGDSEHRRRAARLARQSDPGLASSARNDAGRGQQL